MHNNALQIRWHILRSIREFFWNKRFTEVETPLIVAKPGQEPHLSPMELNVHNQAGKSFKAYLHTSPEYAMKKMLGNGYDKIFTICKTFRDYESFGGEHNPEFTIIEWYRNGGTLEEIMDDCQKLCSYVASSLNMSNNKGQKTKDFFSSWERLTMRELWLRELHVDLDELLTKKSMNKLCNDLGMRASADEPYEDLFYKIFLNKIESKLGQDRPLILSHYPAQMAALATTTDDDKYANRFEIYIKGVEIANAFQELCDPVEQRKRFEIEQKERKSMGKVVFDIDEKLLKALEHIDSAAGIALGIDRLVQIFTSCQNIDDVIPFPLSEQFTIDY